MCITAQPKLSDQLALKIREHIVERQFKPGDRFLSENTLIAMFGVSRSTIREALKLLVAEHVVEIHQGKGAFICQRIGINQDPLGLYFADQKRLLFNLLETRLIIEPQIAQLAAQRATGEDISLLEGIIASFEVSEVSAADTETRFFSLDLEFHTNLANCTKNDVLYRFMPSICDAIWKGGQETLGNTASHERALICHRRILEAIQNRRAEAAQKEMLRHIQQTAQDMHIMLGGMV